MPAKETESPFDNKDWIFEIKWDGYRAIAELNKTDVKLYSRNGNLFNAAYPEVIDALAKMDIDAVVDGEIVVMDEAGNPNFQLLQYYGEERSHPIYYYVFDILKINNQSVMQLPLLERKQKLRTLLKGDGKLRHPIFVRIRDDKPVEDTTMASTKTVTKKQAEIESPPEVKKDAVISFGRFKVPVTHWDKLFWPEEKITKGDVVNYYISIADYILPYLKNRPQSLKRNPGGITGKGFFHKNAGEDVPSFVHTIALYSESSDKEIDYIVCNNKAPLTYLNNLGCIEINPWHSTIQALERPDYLIIDIDPSDKNTFEQVIEAANVVHEILEKARAANFCKTSGATGLHVYIPTKKKYTYDQLKDFAELICVKTSEQLPETTSMERSISKRGNRIYLDHLQNRKEQTIAAAYSLRPHPGATASTPLK